MDFSYNPQILEEFNIFVSKDDFNSNANKVVVVGMSGGVDSSVSALILKLQGYKVIGLFMKNWDETNPDGSCSADSDYQDVIKVAEALGITYYSVNFVKEYWDNVFNQFIADYKSGLTPNPDVLCNKEIKFKVFYQRAKLLGADFLATGHYCQVLQRNDGVALAKGSDSKKDQTYFLYAIDKNVLNEVMFPIGHLEKSKVRELASRFNLATSTKKDSTGICFIGERDFKDFLNKYIHSTKGDFVDLQGRILGTHGGSCFYTLGQRKGMGIGGPGDAWFVADKNHATNEVILAQGMTHPALYADSLIADDVNWLINPPQENFRAKAKVRYRQVEEPCVVTIKGQELEVVFDRPQRAMTPGQSVVFYQDEICLGGARIREVSPNYFKLGKSLPEIFSIQVQ